jgi:hypothetical protein
MAGFKNDCVGGFLGQLFRSAFFFFEHFYLFSLLSTFRSMVDTVTDSAPKKAQPSRKGKKAWRKNVDVTELESGLETLRSEERVR